VQKTESKLATEAPVKVEDLTTAAEKPEKAKRCRKPKANKQTQTVEQNTAKFPTEGKVNKYGFIYLNGDVLAALDLRKGTEQKITIDLQEGALIVRKA